jgi:hypothetical protein
MLGTIGLASITTWLGVRNAREECDIKMMPFELIALAVSWIAVLLIGVYMLQ